MKTLFLLLCSLIVGSSQAQTTEELFKFADEQHAINNLDAAENAYQRVIFFDTTSLKAKAFQRVGDIQFKRHEFNKAAFNYDLAYSSETSDTAKASITLKKAFCLILLEKYQLALVELFSSNDSVFLEKKSFYMGLSYFQIDELPTAQEYFLKTASSDSAKKEINKLFTEYHSKKIKSPSKARTLSSITPGLGQLYAGDIKNAFNSALLTSALGILFIYTGINYGYLDAVLSVLPWLQRYYLGGIKKAGIIVQEKEQKRKDTLRNAILSELAVNSRR